LDGVDRPTYALANETYGSAVNWHVTEFPAAVAVIVTVWFAVTVFGVTVNVTLVAPAGTTTLVGTDA
jgi:hypothetical protein